MKRSFTQVLARLSRHPKPSTGRRQPSPRSPAPGVGPPAEPAVPSIVPTSSPINLGPGQLHSFRTVAEAGNGNYRVVWDGNGIYTQTFNAAGSPLSAVVGIGKTDSTDSGATVAMNDRGESVVAW